MYLSLYICLYVIIIIIIMIYNYIYIYHYSYIVSTIMYLYMYTIHDIMYNTRYPFFRNHCVFCAPAVPRRPLWEEDLIRWENPQLQHIFMPIGNLCLLYINKEK